MEHTEHTDSIPVEVEPRTTWRDLLSARLRSSDHHVSDEEIYAILHAESDDPAVEELCAVKGVTLPMFCVWKQKYRRLGFEQLRDERRREQRRRYLLNGLILATASLLVGAIGVAVLSAAYSTLRGFGTTPSPAAPLEAQVFASTPIRTPAPIKSEPVQISLPREPMPAAPAETGYRIQVTAADTAEQGRAAISRLVSQGFPAYMTAAVVGDHDVFRVRIGPFDTLDAAKEMTERLRAAGYAGVWIAR